MASGYYCYQNVLPFAAMVAAECTAVGINTIFKAASLKGMMNYYVFIFYTALINTILLLPVPLVLSRMIAQLASFKGIEYSSPTLASAMSNLTLPFTFLLAVIFRMEKLDFYSSRTQAKIIGTIVAISGALMVVLYKGPKIKLTPSTKPSLSIHQPIIQTPQLNWVIGGLLFAMQYSLYSVWYIIQAQIMQMYPEKLQVAFMIGLCSTIISAPVCFIAEPNLSAWRLRPDMELAALACTGIGGPLVSFILLWCVQIKGPVYIASFKPLSIAIAAALGVVFLGDSLHIGSVIGAIIVTIGFYAIIWAKVKEEETIEESGCSDHLESSFNSKSPLLISD